MGNYLQSKQKKTCFGCEACVQVCPLRCIELQNSFNGFWYPVIDAVKCTDCDLCEKVCPYEKINNFFSKKESPKVYAARTKSDVILQQSSSGGMFTELAHPVLQKGGIVIGAVLTDDFKVMHQSAVNNEQLSPMRGSKYVQSRIGETYKETDKYLKDGKAVLFTGTPCQIAGLKTYLGRDWDNLTTVDIICHGVLSPDVASYHIKALEQEFGARATRIKFRDKQYGWKKSCAFSIDFEDGQRYCRSGKEDRFFNMFFSNYDLRECCYSCPYTRPERVSDITLGDFWGIEKTKPHLFDDKGHSLVLLNTSKGEKLFSEISKQITFEEARLEQSTQPKLKQPTEPDIWRNFYLRSVRKKGLAYTIETFSKPRPLWQKGIRYFHRKLKKII